jgi:hypothetical protein
MASIASPMPRRMRLALAAIAAAFPILAAHPAAALSELTPLAQPEEAQVAEEAPAAPPLEGPVTGPDGGLPTPAPIIRQETPPPDDTVVELPDTPSDPGPLPEILYDPSKLPEPVARMRQLIIDAATTGDIARLRSLLGTGPTATRLALNDIEGDPVDYLKSVSGDNEGQEILAILLDILNSGYVHIDAGTPDDMFVWPYFAAMPLEALTPPQRVELLRIVTAGDVDDMLAYGSYNFYRVGITPDGEWRIFMTGD